MVTDVDAIGARRGAAADGSALALHRGGALSARHAGQRRRVRRHAAARVAPHAAPAGRGDRAQVRIEHLAHHDQLTDLPNRWLFKDRLDQALRLALSCQWHGRDALRRHRSLQGGQRSLRPRHRRQGAGRGGGPDAGLPAPVRHPGAARRRRVRDRAGRAREQRRRATGRAPARGVSGAAARPTATSSRSPSASASRSIRRTRRARRRCTGPPIRPSIAPRQPAAVATTYGSRPTIGPVCRCAIAPRRADPRSRPRGLARRTPASRRARPALRSRRAGCAGRG